MAKGGIEAPSEAEIKELSEIAIPEKPSREEERFRPSDPFSFA